MMTDDTIFKLLTSFICLQDVHIKNVIKLELELATHSPLICSVFPTFKQSGDYE